MLASQDQLPYWGPRPNISYCPVPWLSSCDIARDRSDMSSCCVTLNMCLNLSGHQVCPVYDEANDIYLDVVSGVRGKEKHERALKRVVRSFLEAKDSSADSTPCCWGGRQSTEKMKCLPQPTSQENPSAFQFWQGGILHRVVSMEKSLVPAIFQTIWPKLYFIILGNFVIWVWEWVVYRATDEIPPLSPPYSPAYIFKPWQIWFEYMCTCVYMSVCVHVLVHVCVCMCAKVGMKGKLEKPQDVPYLFSVQSL